MRLKNISEQTIVITGATSGIGLTTARRAAKAGANLVLVARNEEALRELSNELNANGASAIYYAADVADEAALRGVAAAALEAFDGFDTWVNNAGVSIYGKIADTSDEDMRRLFETNFWGVVYGSRVAAQFLRSSGGGAIINVGSVLSDRAIPIQGIYSASKHAVKGFTDAFRMEIESEKLPISVTLIKPSTINTPYTEHAKNYLENEPNLPPPVYAPDLVAEAILHCAQTPERDFTVGEAGKMLSLMGEYAPRLTDKVMEHTMISAQQKSEPTNPNRPESLHDTNSDLRERGSYEGFVMEESLLQRARLNPVVTGAILVAGGLALATLLSRRGYKGTANRSDEIGDSEREQLQVGHS